MLTMNSIIIKVSFLLLNTSFIYKTLSVEMEKCFVGLNYSKNRSVNFINFM